MLHYILCLKVLKPYLSISYIQMSDNKHIQENVVDK